MHFLCFQLSPIQPLGAATQFCLALQPLTLCQSPRKSVICSSKNSSRKPTGRMFPLLYFFSYSSSFSQNPSIPLSKSFSSFNKLCYLNSFGSSWPVTPTHYCTSLLSPKASGCLMGKKIVTATEKNIKGRPHISASVSISIHLKKCLCFLFLFLFFKFLFLIASKRRSREWGKTILETHYFMLSRREVTWTTVPTTSGCCTLKLQLYAAKEDEWEMRDKVGYLIRRFSQLEKGWEKNQWWKIETKASQRWLTRG